jgi:hypothetical protein
LVVASFAVAQIVILTGCTPSPTNLDDPKEWILVGSYEFPEHGIDARVFSILRSSTFPWDEEIEQTKILVRMPGFDGEFAWPGGRGPSTTASEAQAEPDGSIVFFLSRGKSELRVVTFRDKAFTFRRDSDELTSILAIEVRDLDSDGRREYISEDKVCGEVWCNAPRVFAWDVAKGFIDESNRFAPYFKNEVLPELEARLRTARDEEERLGRELALKYVRSSIGEQPSGGGDSPGRETP